jgi:hypothetical protein
MTWLTLAGSVGWVSSDAMIITANASGTVQIAGWPSSTASHPPTSPPPFTAAPSIDATMAARQDPPPISMPIAAPVLVSRRHQIPSTISGQNDDAAMAKAHPTSRASENRSISSAAVVATAPAISAHHRKEVTPPFMKSCDSAPATLTSRPDEVDRKAAKAPAATRAASISPGSPGSSNDGNARTTLSESVDRYSCGACSLVSTASTAGNR